MNEYEIGIAGVDFDEDDLSGIPQAVRPQVKQLTQKKVAQAVSGSVHTRSQKIGLITAERDGGSDAKGLNDGSRRYKRSQKAVAIELGNAPKGKLAILDGDTRTAKGISDIGGDTGLTNSMLVEFVEVEALVATSAASPATINYDKGLGNVSYGPVRNGDLVITQNGEKARIALSEYDFTSVSPERNTFKVAVETPFWLQSKTPFTIEADIPNVAGTMTAGQSLYLRVILHGQEAAPRSGN